MAPTNIWGSTRAIQNKSLSCGWLILRGCETQGLRPPGTMITTANIIKVSENIYIAPMNVIRRRNCKDNAPKLNSAHYNFKFKFNVTEFQIHPNTYSLQFHAPNSPNIENICMFSLPSYIQARILLKIKLKEKII